MEDNSFSIYRRIVPDLKDFTYTDIEKWDRAIGFHLDYFQSPGMDTWKRRASEHSLTMEPGEDKNDGLDPDKRFRQTIRILHDINERPDFGDVTEMEEFKQALTGEKRLESKAQFFNRVKHKMIDAAYTLAK